MRVSPEQLRKALADMFRNPETRGLIFPYLAPGFPAQGATTTLDRIAKFNSSGGTLDTDAPIQEKLIGSKWCVGVGTPTPAKPLHLYVDASVEGFFDPTLFVEGKNASDGLSLKFQHPGASAGMALVGGGGQWFGTSGSDDAVVWGAPNRNLLFGLGGTEFLRLTGTGNLGIGTGSTIVSGAKLDVADAFFTQEGEIQIRGKAGSSTEGGQLTLRGAGSQRYLYLDNEQGNLRLVTQDTSGESVNVTVLNNGNAGFGAANPSERVEVAGNIKSQGLNQIIFLTAAEHNAGTRTINGASAALPAEGGIIMLQPGTYLIGGTITNKPSGSLKCGVKLRGYGGDSPDSKAISGPLTKLVWNGSAGGEMLKFFSDQASKNVQDFEICDLTIDGQKDASTFAGYGVILDQVARSIFRNVHIRNVRKGTNIEGIGLLLTTSATTVDVGCSWNLFQNCSVFDCSKGVSLRGNTASNANSSHNTFIGLQVQFLGQAPNGIPDAVGIELKDCDNNGFYSTWIFRNEESGIGGLAGHGVRVVSPDKARSNYFFHLQASGGGFFVNNSSTGLNGQNSRNLIFGYDEDNSQPEPVTDSETTRPAKNYVAWVNSKGEMRGVTVYAP